MKPKSRFVVVRDDPHGEEDRAGAERRVADQRRAVPHLQGEIEDRPEPPAEQPRHEKQQQNAERAVAVGGDAELQADHRPSMTKVPMMGAP